MTTIGLRPLNELELRLYREKVGHLHSLTTDLDAPPTRRIRQEAGRVASLFEHIGMVPTSIGPMMRMEDDICDRELDEAAMKMVQADIRMANAIMASDWVL